jgi:hypothetical protein
VLTYKKKENSQLKGIQKKSAKVNKKLAHMEQNGFIQVIQYLTRWGKGSIQVINYMSKWNKKIGPYLLRGGTKPRLQKGTKY